MKTATGHESFWGLEGVDAPSYGAFQSFMKTLHLHRQLMVRMLAEKGSHMGNAACLRVLSAQDGISQRDLAETLHLSRPTVTGMLQLMEKNGAIERRADEKDQRLTRVYLTDEGRKMDAHLRAGFAEYVERTFGEMPENDRRDLERLLDELSENIQRALQTTNETGQGEATE
jgi:MarR family transcriptional regulator, organic hydroperoxide resistance regulator